MASAGPVLVQETIKPTGLRSVISDLASLDLSFLTAWRHEPAANALSSLPEDVTDKEHEDHSGAHHPSTGSEKELPAVREALPTRPQPSQLAKSASSAGGSPEPITCQVACLSWPGSKDGFKKSNQDAYCFMRTTDKKSLIFGVFDGHGSRGRDASQLVKKRMPELLMAEGDGLLLDTKGAFEASFRAMQDEIFSQDAFDCTVSGTTAVMAHLYQRTLTVAWAGDSRAVLAREDESGELVAEALSEDHKPENESEKERIEASNGCVYRDVNEMGEDVGPYRVWSKGGHLIGLAMSRSLGDRLAHGIGVAAEPDVRAFELCPEDKFVILASDGVWEWVSNEEAIGIVKSCATSQEGAKKLMQEAKSRWLARDVGSYVDDITALVVTFNHIEV